MGDSTIKVNSFTIKPQNDTTTAVVNSHPKEFKMFASNNSSTWTEISHVSDLSDETWYTNSLFQNYTVSLNTPLEYQYWRLVVSKVIDATQVSIGELELNGFIITNVAQTFTDVNKLEIAY